MQKRIYYFRFGFLGVLIGLASCTVGPKYHPPVTQAPPVYKESPAQFKESDGWTVADPQDAMLRGKWWAIFKEPELNALEEKLNIDNQNIKQFFENFMEARALIREARAQYYPHCNVLTDLQPFARFGEPRGRCSRNEWSYHGRWSPSHFHRFANRSLLGT